MAAIVLLVPTAVLPSAPTVAPVPIAVSLASAAWLPVPIGRPLPVPIGTLLVPAVVSSPKTRLVRLLKALSKAENASPTL